MASRVAVIGAVGVPACYGGFETLAEALAKGILPSHAALTIYCQKDAYPVEERSAEFAGHRRVFLPLPANGPLSILYDFISVFDALVIRRCDTLLCLGASGGLAFPFAKLFFPRRRIIFNVDGLESRRARWSRSAKLLLGLLEWIGVKSADVIVADNRVIRSIVHRLYKRKSTVIAYGGDSAAPGQAMTRPAVEDLPERFALAISRIVPENNVDLILEAFSGADLPLVYVGNWAAAAYGRQLREKFATARHMRLLDPIYDKAQLDWLRSRAELCVHGHSVGGTNPSLVEALHWAPQIFSFDCAFNRATLDGQFHYWRNVGELRALLAARAEAEVPDVAAIGRLRERYTWRSIAASYEHLFCEADERMANDC